MDHLALPLALAVLAAQPALAQQQQQQQQPGTVQLEPGLTVALPASPPRVDFTLDDAQAGTVRSVTWTRVSGGVLFVAGYLEARPAWARAQGADALLDLGQRHLFPSDVQLREVQAQQHLGRPARALSGASPAARERALLFVDGRRVYLTRLREPGSVRAPGGDAFLGSLTPAGAAPAGTAAPVTVRRFDITRGQTVSWQLEPQQGAARTQDLFVYRGRAGERVLVGLSTSTFQPMLQVAQVEGEDLSDAARLVEARSDDTTGLRSVYVALTLPADGTYALAPGGTGTGPYTLSLEVQVQREEPPRATPVTTRLVPGRAHRGRLLRTDAVDAGFRAFQRFTFDAREGVTYVLRVEAPELPQLGAGILRLRLPDGEPVTEARLTAQDEGKLEVRFRAVETGTYQLELAAPAHDSQLPAAFTLSVAEEGATVADASTVGPVNATPARALTPVLAGGIGPVLVSDQDGLLVSLDLVLGLGGQPTPSLGLDVVVSPGVVANGGAPEGEKDVRFTGLAGPRLRLGRADGNWVGLTAGAALLTAPSDTADHSVLGLGGRIDWMPFGNEDDTDVGVGGRIQKHGDVTLLMGALYLVF